LSPLPGLPLQRRGKGFNGVNLRRQDGALAVPPAHVESVKGSTASFHQDTVYSAEAGAVTHLIGKKDNHFG
jgi:hypothetical protein